MSSDAGLEETMRRIFAGREARDRRLREGPVRVSVQTMQTGPGAYTRTIWRLGEPEPVAVQQLRGSFETGTRILEGAAAERLLAKAAAKSGA